MRRRIEKYNGEKDLKISKRTICNLVVLDDDVVGALGLFKLPGPRNAHRCQG